MKSLHTHYYDELQVFHFPMINIVLSNKFRHGVRFSPAEVYSLYSIPRNESDNRLTILPSFVCSPIRDQCSDFRICNTPGIDNRCLGSGTPFRSGARGPSNLPIQSALVLCHHPGASPSPNDKLRSPLTYYYNNIHRHGSCGFGRWI